MTDRAARQFETLYRTHYRAVAGFVGRRLRPDLVEDTVHEIFLVAWRRSSDARDPGIGWLLGIARNVVLERYRAGSRIETIYREASEALLRQPMGLGADDEVIERLAAFAALGARP